MHTIAAALQYAFSATVLGDLPASPLSTPSWLYFSPLCSAPFPLAAFFRDGLCATLQLDERERTISFPCYLTPLELRRQQHCALCTFLDFFPFIVFYSCFLSWFQGKTRLLDIERGKE
jgi:hypothetical protein